MAEPINKEETEFLKNQAEKYSNPNWWIGLREAENCQCRQAHPHPDPSPRAGITTAFDATIDYSTLTDSSNYGYVKSICPSTGK